jgi:hypothetical protein
VLQQEYASPVVLNMIVAALLLQTNATTEKFSTIYDQCIRVYYYLVRRGGVKMVMRLPPRAEAVLDTIVKLGFKVTEVDEKRKSRVKKFDINMDAKRDQKMLLGLSYYSNNLLQNLLMDACIGKMVVRHMIAGGRQEVPVSELIGLSE